MLKFLADMKEVRSRLDMIERSLVDIVERLTQLETEVARRKGGRPKVEPEVVSG